MTSDAERSPRSEPETLRLRGIVPSITVDDVDASLRFYRDIVGFTVKELWEHDGEVGGAELIAGTSNLMLVQDDFAKGRDRTKGVGFRLYFTTGQDVDEVAAAIESRGGALASQPEDMPWGSRAFSIVDPDGFAITVASQRE